MPPLCFSITINYYEISHVTYFCTVSSVLINALDHLLVYKTLSQCINKIFIYSIHLYLKFRKLPITMFKVCQFTNHSKMSEKYNTEWKKKKNFYNKNFIIK